MLLSTHLRWFSFLVLCAWGLLVAAPTVAADDLTPDVDALAGSLANLTAPAAQLQPVGWRTATAPRTGGGTFTLLVIYPATTAGFDTPFDPSQGPYPAVSFGHGFFQHPDRYQPTLEHLASYGYIVVAPESELGLFPSHAQFAQDLSDALTWLESENDSAASPFYQGVATDRFGVSGHSMGGGASILAAAADSRVKAVLNMAAAETNPSAKAAMANVQVPISLLSGSEDAIVPYETNGQEMYNNGNAPRLLPLLIGGYHCGFQDTPFPFFCDSGSMDAQTQLELTRQHLVAFFGLYLKQDQSYWPYVWGPFTLTNPLVTVESDPGMTLAPFAQTQQGSPGATLSYTVTLTHDDDQPASYRVFKVGNLWPATVTPAQTSVLNPGETATILVEVSVPDAGSNRDLLILSVRSDNDGLTRQDAYIVSRRP